MEGIIVNFRSGVHTQAGNQMIVKVSSIEDKAKAAGLIGKKVTWTNDKGNSIVGKVASSHGNSGALRIIFEKGMPGQAIGKKVIIE